MRRFYKCRPAATPIRRSTYPCRPSDNPGRHSARAPSQTQQKLGNSKRATLEKRMELIWINQDSSRHKIQFKTFPCKIWAWFRDASLLKFSFRFVHSKQSIHTLQHKYKLININQYHAAVRNSKSNHQEAHMSRCSQRFRRPRKLKSSSWCTPTGPVEHKSAANEESLCVSVCFCKRWNHVRHDGKTFSRYRLDEM